MKRIAEYEIVDHGVDHAQYFQGHGVSGEWDDAFTGAGDNAVEAYNDAVENASHEYDTRNLPVRPRGLNARRDRVRHTPGDEESEMYYYVSLNLREGVYGPNRKEYGTRRGRDHHVTPINSLKMEAMLSARQRGHRMGNWKDQKHTATAISECQVCGKYVQVIAKPAANEIAIGGSALATACATDGQWGSLTGRR